MSLLDSLSRGWYGGWAELPEVGAGASGLLARLYPGEEEDPFEKLKNKLNLTAEEWRDKGPEGESTGLLEKIAEGIGAAPGTVASMAPFLAATAGTGGVGAIAGAAAGMGLHGLVRHGDEDLREAAGYGLKGAAEGALFGGAGAIAGRYAPKAAQGLMRKQLQAATPEEKLALQPAIDAALNTPTAQLARRGLHGGLAGGVVGGMGLVHGQSVEDAAAGAASMGLLGALGGMTPKQIAEGGRYRDPFTSVKKALDENEAEIRAWHEGRGERLKATEKEQPAAPVFENEAMTVGGATVFKNPSSADIEALQASFRAHPVDRDVLRYEMEQGQTGRDFGIRYLYDQKGNEYAFRADESSHTDMMSSMKRRIGDTSPYRGFDPANPLRPTKIKTEEAPVSDLRAAGERSRPFEKETQAMRDRIADMESESSFRAARGYDKVNYRPRTNQDVARRAVENLVRDADGKIKFAPEDLDAAAAYLSDALEMNNRKLADIDAKVEAARSAGDEIAAASLREQADAIQYEMVNDFLQFKGVRSTAGNAMRMLRRAKPGTTEWLDASNKIKKNLGVHTDRFNEMLRMSRDNPELIAKLAKAVDTPSLWDQFQEYWINGLLSGPPTHLVNMSSNALRAGIDVIEKGGSLIAEATRGSIKLDKSGKPVLDDSGQFVREKITKADALGEFMADITAGIQSLRMAGRVLAGSLKNEDFDVTTVSPRLGVHVDSSKLDYQSKAISGKAGEIIRYPGRALQAMDIYWKTIAGERAAAAKAYRMATEAIKNKEITEAQRVEYMAKLRGADGGEPHKEILAAMKKEGRAQTFTEDLPPWMAGAEKIRQTEIAGMRPIVGVVPFMKTPFNVIKQSLARSPLGILTWKKLNADYEAGRITSKEYYQQKVGTVLGSTIALSLIGLAKAGLITGSGPENPQDLQNKIATGWRPYSLKVGDVYVPMQRVEPLGTLVGMAGDIAEFGDAEDKMGKMMSIIKDNATDKTFLYGVEALAKAWSEPKQFGSTWYRQMAGSLVPNIVAKGAQAVDPYARDVETTGARVGIPDPMAYRIPGLSTALPQRQTALGEPAERWSTLGTSTPATKVVSGLQAFISPSPVSQVRPNTEVEQEFDRLSKEPGMPPAMPRRNKQISLRGVNGESVKLTDDEFAVYDKHHENAKRQLAMIIQAPAYRMMQDEQKAKLLRSIYDKHREMANREINMRVRRRSTVGN